MNARWIAVLWLALAGPALSQGFAGMGQDADGFAMPRPEPRFVFPQDHGSHPDFRIEWWYLTANLKGEDGRDYGVQWTLFRNALAPGDANGWATPQIWMGHAGLTTQDRHFSAERFARGGIGTASVAADPFEAFIGDWTMAGPDLNDIVLTARGAEFAYALRARATGPFVRQGDKGYSVKSPEGQASYYYSQPFYEVSGEITLPDGPITVTGTAWLDREWSSQPLASDQTGWDWFALNLPDGEKLMAFRLRHEDRPDFHSGTWIAADGTPNPFDPDDLVATPLEWSDTEGGSVPTTWRLEIPGRGLDIVITAINTQSWMRTAVAYWEGPVRFEGTHAGVGYLEMTGYDTANP
ncbi:MAG: lipocalin-like domain-containing protein [Pseudomonadota bacterium]